MTQENLDQTPLPPEQQELQVLHAHYFGIASGRPNVDTLAFLREEGDGLRRSLVRIRGLVGKTAHEKEVDELRGAYIGEVMQRHQPWARHSYNLRCKGVRDEYVDAVVGATEMVVDAQTDADALALLQMPTIIEKTSFTESTSLTMEDFSANHLYVLIDTALKEHVSRRHLIAEHQGSTPYARFVKNRVVRMAVLFGVFAATFIPETHVIPIENHMAADEVNVTLRVLSAGVFGVEAPEEIRWRRLDRIHKKQSKKLQEELADDTKLSDLALRAIYSSTRYRAVVGSEITTASDEKERTLARFASLDTEFQLLNNDPGGKPYSGNQALGYAARLLVERQKQLSAILESHGKPETQKELYLELVRSIIVEDLRRMEKGLRSSKLRQRVLRLVGIIPAVLFSNQMAIVSEASSGSKDVVDAINPRDGRENDDRS